MIFELITYLKHNHRLQDIFDVVEDNKRRQNESKSLSAKKESRRVKVEGKLKEIAEWDDFHDAFTEI